MNAECVNYLGTNNEMETLIFKVETKSIHEVLLGIGIPPNILGYCYILYALELILFNPNYLRGITKQLYPDVAKKFNTTPVRVERDIRHAISVAWLRGDLDFIDEIFKNCVDPEKGVPSNSLFLTRIYHHIITTK